MATYCIGDVHGCYNEFMALLEEIKFDETKDELILTGDLIGRGPFPVETMKAVMSMKNTVSVLGNHDLNFLAVAEGIVTPRPKDNLQVILDSPICDDIVKYFINSPLLYIHKTKSQDKMILRCALVLLLIGIVAFLGILAKSFSDELKENVGFNVVLRGDATSEQVAAMDKMWQTVP